MEEHRSELELERMRERGGWAETLVRALRLEESTEPVHCAMMERLLEERDLREARESSRTHRDKDPAETLPPPPEGDGGAGLQVRGRGAGNESV